MLMMTYGGTTSNVCHGGGLQHQSISDRVMEIEYVDADGNVSRKPVSHTFLKKIIFLLDLCKLQIQIVNDPEELKVAAGAFGLLGVLLSITFKMDEMTYANYQPKIVQESMEEYMPRPGNDLPDYLIDLFEVFII